MKKHKNYKSSKMKWYKPTKRNTIKKIILKMTKLDATQEKINTSDILRKVGWKDGTLFK